MTKPVVGVFDLASNVSEGIKNTTTIFEVNELDRVRLPRFIGADGILKPFNSREALGCMWLTQAANGKYIQEHYVAHIDIKIDQQVILVFLL